MPNPWEKYQTEEAEGPWSKYTETTVEEPAAPEPPYTGPVLGPAPGGISGTLRRLRQTPAARAILGPTDIEKELIESGEIAGAPSGQIGAVPIAEKLLEFTSPPPPVRKVLAPVAKYTDPLRLGGEHTKGAAEALEELVTGMPIAPIPGGVAGKTAMTLFAADYARNLPGLLEQRKAAQAAGDDAAVQRITTQIGLGAAMNVALPAAHVAAGRAARRLPTPEELTGQTRVVPLPGETVQPVPGEAPAPRAEVLPSVPRPTATPVQEALPLGPEAAAGVPVEKISPRGTLPGTRAIEAPPGEQWYGPNGPVELKDVSKEKGTALVRYTKATGEPAYFDVPLSQLYRRKVRGKGKKASKHTPEDAAELAYLEAERKAINEGVSANEAAGLNAKVKIVDEALPEGEPFAGKIASITPDGITVNRTQFRKWLEQIPKRRQAKAVRTLFSEEGIHFAVRNAVGDAALADLWKSGLTDFERGLTRKSYWGRNVPKELSDAQYGHEYIRRVNQWAMKKGVREVAEATTLPDWLTEAGIDVALRGVHQARRALAAAPAIGRIGGMGARLKAESAASVAAMLDKTQASLEAAKANRAYWDKKREEGEPLAAVPKEEGIASQMATALEVPSQELKSFKGKFGGGPTGYLWEIGSKARTAEDVAQLRKVAEESTQKINELKKEGKFMEAMAIAGRQPAEAYEFATGVKLDGTPKWDTLERMVPGYKPPVPDPQYLAAKGISPERMVAAVRKETAVEAVQEKPVQEELFGGLTPRMFYSRAVKAVEGTKQGAASGAQWKSQVKNSGISPDEMEIVGLDSLEDGKRYERNEVLNLVKANEPVVKDVNFADFSVLDSIEEKRAKGELLSPKERALFLKTEGRIAPFGEDQFVLPGADYTTYKEVLLTVPDLAPVKGEKPSWVDGHEEYSEFPNPIVRLRHTDRMDLFGRKVLFLEEIQPPNKKPLEGEKVGNFERMPKLLQNNWKKIAFKWALQKAAREGYDSVGWTTGKQQMDRYTTNFDTIRWEANGPSEYSVEYKSNGRTISKQYVPSDAFKEYISGLEKHRFIKNVDLSKQFYGEIPHLDVNLTPSEGLRKLYDEFGGVVEKLPSVREAGGKAYFGSIFLDPGEGSLQQAYLIKVPEKLKMLAAEPQPLAARRKKTAQEIGQEMMALPEVPKGAAVERPTAEAAGAIIPEPPSVESARTDALAFLTSKGAAKPNYKDFERSLVSKHGDSAKEFTQQAWVDAVWSRVQKMSPEELAQLNDRLLNMSEREVQAAAEARQRAAQEAAPAEEIPKPPARTPAFETWQKQVQKLERRGALDFTNPSEKAQFADMAAESARLRRQLRFGQLTLEETTAIRDKLAEWETVRGASAALNRLKRQPEHAAQLEAEQRYKMLREPERESAKKLALRGQQRATMMADVAQRLIKQTVSPEVSLERSNIGPEEIGWEVKRTGEAWKEFEEGTSPSVLEKSLTQGSRVSGQPESVTRRVASVRDNLTGEVIMVSTYKTGGGDYMIVNPEKVSKRPNTSINNLLREKTAGGKPRYTVLASGLLEEPVRNYKRRFESEAQWRDQFADEAAAQAEAAAGRHAEAVSRAGLAERLEEAGFETEERTPRAMVPPEQRVEPTMPVEAKEEPPPATPEQIQQRRLQEEQARLTAETRARYFGARAGLDAWLRKQAILNAPRPGAPMQPPPAPKVWPPVTTTGARELTMRERLAPTVIRGQQLPKGPGPKPELAAVLKPAGKSLVEWTRDLIREPARMYSEWMVQRLQRVGGPITKTASQEFNRIIDAEKGYYGSLNQQIPQTSLDPAAKAATTAAASRLGVLKNRMTGQDNGLLDMARTAAGRPGKATTWLHRVDPVTRRAGISNAVGAMEGTTPVPAFARDTVLLGRMANILIGRMLEPVVKGFKAIGSWQRNLTAFGYDVIRSGAGRVWSDWAEGLAGVNGLTPNVVQGFFKKWKRILDEPGVDSNTIERVNQEFARTFPNTVTHVKVGDIGGGRWQEVVHGNLFSYLESAARRATHARSFREVYPNTPNGRQAFGAMQRAAREELGPSHQQDWDALMRALQGHPSDTYSASSVWGPGRGPGELARNLNQTVGNVLARSVLTGQMAVQPGENIAGSIPVFLGYRNYARAVARLRQLYPELETRGAVNRVVYDYSFDPASPIRSSARITGNVISKVFMEQMLNELQEATAAATARVVSERIQAGTLSGWEKRQLPMTLKAMGFSKAQVADMMARRAPELLGEFERKAATFLTSGNKAIAEGSPLGASRLINSLFRFQSYPMMKMNQFRKVLGNAGDAFSRTGTARERIAASEQLARFLVGNALQGALTVGITALFYEGLTGAAIRKEEAKDEPLRFFTEVFLSSMSGPLYLVWRGARDRGLLGIGEQATRLLFPYSILRDMHDAATGSGSYKSLDAQDRLAKFAASKVPGARALMTGFAAVGLSQPNRNLDIAIRAFNRWRRSELGFSQEEGVLKDDTRKAFRISMKKAVEALKKGDFDAYREAINEAAGQEGVRKPLEAVNASLRARKILKTPDGKPLDLDQMDALRKRIGSEAVDRLQWFDLMLDKAAEGVLLGPYE